MTMCFRCDPSHYCRRRGGGYCPPAGLRAAAKKDERLTDCASDLFHFCTSGKSDEFIR